MRKVVKEQAANLIRQMQCAHDRIWQQPLDAIVLLEECQNAAITLGTQIEKTEGGAHPLVSLLESYCELVYQFHESLPDSGRMESEGLDQALDQKLADIASCLEHDVQGKIEAVFLPYKASMWDSLESVWMAANADPDCDAYVIPVPYYDKNPDGSLGARHCEAKNFPADVPVMHYDAYDLEEHRPELIFIHNPYDYANHVTSVEPFYYSENLKKLTDCLVYIPYYATAGGMAEGQALCPAYLHADYIVVQSGKHRSYFDARIPDEKFLTLGSPKFDSVIQKCENPPEPPEEWKDRLEGRTVYFYNTSIGGMLQDTRAFLNKMRYVFDAFKGRTEACLLWRPHPLLESTFDSLRRECKPAYDALKQEFLGDKIGIFDTTPDIENSIALSDIYIGDSGTSVTSLFGVAGKPLFIMSNFIHAEPGEDDWRGTWINPQFDPWGNDKYLITYNNLLWISENNDYHYRFFLRLGCEYAAQYFQRAVEMRGRIYVLPSYARYLLIIENRKIRRIELEEHITHAGAFWNYYYNERYIFLFPFRYPYLVRFDVETEQVCYVDGVQEFQSKNVDGEWLTGGFAPYGDELVIASPTGSKLLFLNMETLKGRILDGPSECNRGMFSIVPDKDELWLLPMKGMTIICWNPKTGFARAYSDVPQSFFSVKWPYEIRCEEKPFYSLAIARTSEKETIVIAPYWGNGFLALDRKTGEFSEWRPQMELALRGKNGYFLSDLMGYFPITYLPQGGAKHRIWHYPERKLYEVDLNTGECRELVLELDYGEAIAHEPGFVEESEWMPYCLSESALNSLRNLLDHEITGSAFDRDRQLRAFAEINANTKGTCGEQVYQFVKERVR